jgi:endonuclease YncB( thermonuclease family)
MGCIHSAHPTPVERLVRSTIENTPKLSFDGQTILAKVLEVHDGDTITVAFIVDGTLGRDGTLARQDGIIFQGKCRLEGIDTAEIVQVKNEQERKVGIQGRDYLSKLILNQMVTIQCPRGEHDKYGRALVGTVFLDGDNTEGSLGLNVNNEMIAKGFAYRYYGGKKKKFSEWYDVPEEAKQTFWQCCGNSVDQTKRCPACQSWCCNGCKLGDNPVHRKTTVKCGKCRDHCPNVELDA